jgi:hypothetical protein
MLHSLVDDGRDRAGTELMVVVPLAAQMQRIPLINKSPFHLSLALDAQTISCVLSSDVV